MSDSRKVGVGLGEFPVGRVSLRDVVSAWRADGAEDDWWQEARGADGAVYDINIYDSGVHGRGPDVDDVGMLYCVYRTVELADGLRDTDVSAVLARGTLASLEV